MATDPQDRATVTERLVRIIADAAYAEARHVCPMNIEALTAGIDRLIADACAEAVRERDKEWSEALAPGNRETDLGTFMLEPKRAASVIAEGQKLAVDGAVREERAKIEEIEKMARVYGWKPEEPSERPLVEWLAVVIETETSDLSNALSDRIREVRAEEYERGYKDGREERAKIEEIEKMARVYGWKPEEPSERPLVEWLAVVIETETSDRQFAEMKRREERDKYRQDLAEERERRVRAEQERDRHKHNAECYAAECPDPDLPVEDTRLYRAEQERDEARLERAELERLDKYESKCACMVDGPDEVCLAHSPAVARAEQRVKELEEQLQKHTVERALAPSPYDPEAVSQYLRKKAGRG